MHTLTVAPSPNGRKPIMPIRIPYGRAPCYRDEPTGPFERIRAVVPGALLCAERDSEAQTTDKCQFTSAEVILEVDYKIPVFRGVRLQPNVQYMFRPNAPVSIRDAAVFGFRASVDF